MKPLEFFKQIYALPSQYDHYDHMDRTRIAIQKTMLINGFFFGGVFLALCAYFQVYQMVYLSIFYSLCLAIAIFVLEKLNAPWAASKATSVIMAGIIVYGSLFVGKESFLHIFLLGYIGLPFIMLPHSHRKWQLVNLVVLIAAFMVVEFSGIQIPGSEIITSDFQKYCRTLMILVGMVFVFNQFFFFSSESDRIQNEIKEQGVKIARTKQLNSLTGMAAGVAHEINNPLAIISSTSQVVVQVLTMSSVEDKKAHIIRYMNKINNGVERIAKIVNGLRILSRDERDDHIVSVNFLDMLDEVLLLFKERTLEKQIEIHWRGKRPQVCISTREVLIKQVILNLIENSIQAVEKLEERWIEFEFALTEEELLVYFSDSGFGLPEDVAEKVFQPFFSTKEGGSSTGIGLSICKTIMNQQGGDLELLRDRAHTTFLLRFPVAQVHVEQKDIEEAA